MLLKQEKNLKSCNFQIIAWTIISHCKVDLRCLNVSSLTSFFLLPQLLTIIFSCPKVCVDKLLKGICEMFSVGLKNICTVYMREGRLLTKPGWSLACPLKKTLKLNATAAVLEKGSGNSLKWCGVSQECDGEGVQCTSRRWMCRELSPNEQSEAAAARQLEPAGMWGW